jgi:hypothetical protein
MKEKRGLAARLYQNTFRYNEDLRKITILMPNVFF